MAETLAFFGGLITGALGTVLLPLFCLSPRQKEILRRARRRHEVPLL